MAKRLRDLGWVSWEEDAIPDDIWYFNAIGKNAWSWFWRSRGLHFAANTLREKLNNRVQIGAFPFGHTITLMLGGYAIETLLKMVIISAHNDEHEFSLNSTQADAFLEKTHDLVKLARKSGLRTNKSDRKTLSDLTRYVVWAGRYPVPSSAEGFSDTTPDILDRGPKSFRLWDRYNALYQKLLRLSVRKVPLS